MQTGRTVARKTRLKLGQVQYAYEKFYLAVRALATGSGDVRSRLRGAYLHFHTVQPEDVPGNVRRDFRWIKRMLTKRQPRYVLKGEIIDGSVEVSLAQMQNRTGSKIARKIVRIEEALESACESTK